MTVLLQLHSAPHSTIFSLEGELSLPHLRWIVSELRLTQYVTSSGGTCDTAPLELTPRGADLVQRHLNPQDE